MNITQRRKNVPKPSNRPATWFYCSVIPSRLSGILRPVTVTCRANMTPGYEAEAPLTAREPQIKPFCHQSPHSPMVLDQPPKAPRITPIILINGRHLSLPETPTRPFWTEAPSEPQIDTDMQQVACCVLGQTVVKWFSQQIESDRCSPMCYCLVCQNNVENALTLAFTSASNRVIRANGVTQAIPVPFSNVHIVSSWGYPDVPASLSQWTDRASY